MWELRLILILIGVVLIAAIYLLSRQRKTRPERSHRDPPTLQESNLPDIPAEPPAAGFGRRPMQNSATRVTAPAVGNTDTEKGAGPDPDPERLILALHVACRDPDGFAGADLIAACESTGLRYGQYQVFHRLSPHAEQQSVFSVANMVEPGVLDPQRLPEMRVPGVTLFLLLPGPQDGVAACADMLATARSLARQLDGDVLDESHKLLTPQTAQQIRERILAFQNRAGG
jgi:cell division protein ZipA